MPEISDVPTIEEIVADLRVLREKGLVRLRHTDLVSLHQAAAHTSLPAAVGGGPGAVEAMLRAAVDNLGGGSLGSAAMATFGLTRGMRDMPAQDRRRRAAMTYGVSIERFRKYHERIVVEQVAEELLKLCAPQGQHASLVDSPAELDRQIRLVGHLGDRTFPVVVHVEPIELLSGVDIIVVSENVYFELPQYFKSSVSAAIRRAAAIRNLDGEIVTDVVSDELRSWVRENGRVGLPIAPGTVVATSPGEMANQGVRAIYHVAIAVPRPGTNNYDVELTAIATGIRNVLATARANREYADPPLRSLALPLLGTGRAALDPATSFAWLWAPLERDMRENGPWEIHFVTRRRVFADVIVNRLTELKVVSDH